MDRPPRKHKFAPKPPRTKSKPPVAKPEQDQEEDPENAQAQDIIRRFNANRGFQRPKDERKSQSQPETEFDSGAGSSSSSSLKKFSTRRSVEAKDADSMKNLHMNEAEDEDTSDDEEYNSPFEDDDSPPLRLPFRPPKSGNPEALNEIEFSEEALKVQYDDRTVNAAKELHLLEKSEERKLFLFQLPSVLPLPTRKGTTAKFEDLPAGYMGKMLVYKSGKVKMKLGETVFDVSPGSDAKNQPDFINPDSGSMFPPDAAVINTKKKECCIVGRIDKRVVVTPDLYSILDSLNINDNPGSSQNEETSKRKKSSDSPSKKQKQ